MKKYGLIGRNLGHSMSKIIHDQLFALSGRQAQYDIYDVDSVQEFLAVSSDVIGYNVTIPYKEEIFKLLDNLHCNAEMYRSVNCVDCNGVGYNTDVDGFRQSVEQVIMGYDVKALILGFGGVGKMIAKQFDASKLTIAIRNIDEAKCHEIFSLIGDNVKIVDFNNIPIEEYEIIINATPIGMFPNVDACPVPCEVISYASVVYDTIYNPISTKLINRARDCGVTAKSGLDMLVYQAAVAHKYWYGAVFNKKDIDDIVINIGQMLS